MDPRAIFRLDIGFYIGIALWPLPGPPISSNPLGLPGSIDRSSREKQGAADQVREFLEFVRNRPVWSRLLS